MMDHVAYDEAAHHRWPRHAENSLPAAQQRPRLRPVGVAGFLQGGARVFYVLVESRQHFGPSFEIGGLRVWTTRRSHVKGIRGQRVHHPARDLRQVRCQSAQRHGFFVRLPVELAVRRALQTLARECNFAVKLRKQRVFNCHGSLPKWQLDAQHAAANQNFTAEKLCDRWRWSPSLCRSLASHRTDYFWISSASARPRRSISSWHQK